MSTRPNANFGSETDRRLAAKSGLWMRVPRGQGTTRCNHTEVMPDVHQRAGYWRRLSERSGSAELIFVRQTSGGPPIQDGGLRVEMGEHVLRRIAKFAAAVAFAASLVSNAETTIWTPNGEKQFVGHALDYATGKPLPGGWIIATYVLGPGGIHEPAHCGVAEAVQADSDGKYVLPFYDGRPPQFLDAFGHRYKKAPSPRNVTRDVKTLQWIVTITEVVNGKGVVVGREGPFSSEEVALKASNRQRDVWLQPFAGTDDEWITWLSRSGTHAESGCPSYVSRGIVDWLQAMLDEVQSMSDSKAKDAAVDHLKGRIEFAKQIASGAQK